MPEHTSNAPHQSQSADLWRELCECQRQLALAVAETQLRAAYAAWQSRPHGGDGCPCAGCRTAYAAAEAIRGLK